MTDQELIDKYDLTNHPMWNVEVGVWCQSIHDKEPFEQTTEPGRNRLIFVVANNPEHEIPIRLAAMMPCAPGVAAKIKSLHDDYLAKRKSLHDDYLAKRKPLYDDYLAKRKSLYDDYEAKRKSLYDDYEAKRKPLHDDYLENRKWLYDDYLEKIRPLYVGDWFDWGNMTLKFDMEVKK